jgi:cobalamin biosynthesis Mg chelatase CobN
VLALLAFACFPVLAQAETVYEQESTTLPGNGGGSSPSHNPDSGGSSPKAHWSGAPDGGGSEGSTPGSSESQNRASKESNPSTPGGGSQAQGEKGNGVPDGKQSGLELETAKPLGNSTTVDDDSSSPLVPILIAVAVLAAISVGAVLYRQRRGGSGGLFSPKAS